jgi:prepilin-type N-terminal cleavage/methylation domain-containing protein
MGQRGYALTELLVAVAVAGIVGSGIVTLFQASMTQATHAASLEDAQSGARFGLDQMVRELQVAGAYYSGAGGAGSAITTATPTTITFIGDVNADTVSGSTETTLVASTVTTLTVSSATGFDVYASAALNDYVYVQNGSTREVRQIAAGGVIGSVITLAAALTNTYPNGSIVRSAEIITYNFNPATGTLTRQLGGGTTDTLLTNVSSFGLTYFDAAGGGLAATPTDPSTIKEVQVSVGARGSDGAIRTMNSRVRLRN